LLLFCFLKYGINFVTLAGPEPTTWTRLMLKLRMVVNHHVVAGN
jgi:hypothetical protein